MYLNSLTFKYSLRNHISPIQFKYIRRVSTNLPTKLKQQKYPNFENTSIYTYIWVHSRILATTRWIGHAWALAHRFGFSSTCQVAFLDFIAWGSSQPLACPPYPSLSYHSKHKMLEWNRQMLQFWWTYVSLTWTLVYAKSYIRVVYGKGCS